MTGNPLTTNSRHWRTGILPLVGLLIGAGVGALSGDPINTLPVAVAAGMALGVGLDSAANHLINERKSDDD